MDPTTVFPNTLSMMTATNKYLLLLPRRQSPAAMVSPLLLTLLFAVAAPSFAAQTLKLPLLRRQSPSLDLQTVSLLSTSARGQYFVEFFVGTPPQRLLLAADTASNLIWVRCSACRDCSRHRPGAAFFLRHSSSFSPFHCYDPQCRLLPRSLSDQTCPNRKLHSPCRYRSAAGLGFFGKDTATMNATFEISFGCAFNVTAKHGVVGLGRGPLSLPSQLARRYGGAFGYCLTDDGGFLRFGGAVTKPLRYTPLQKNPGSPTLYYVGIDGVAVDGVDLPIEPAAWAMDPSSGGGGMVVDSGATLSFLPEQAYRQVLAAMERRISLPRVPNSGFDLCVNGSEEELPKLGLKLGGGEIFSPPPRNYFLEAEPGVRCFAVLPVSSEGGSGVIGSLMQRGFLFVFDVHGARLGFSAGCR